MRPLTLGLLVVAALAAQQRVEVTLERRDTGTWKSADPGHVFANGDQVRFRFKANFTGFLYVVNEGTSGGHHPATFNRHQKSLIASFWQAKCADYAQPAAACNQENGGEQRNNIASITATITSGSSSAFTKIIDSP